LLPESPSLLSPPEHSIPGDTSLPWVNSGDEGNVKVALSTFSTRVSVPPLPEENKLDNIETDGVSLFSLLVN